MVQLNFTGIRNYFNLRWLIRVYWFILICTTDGPILKFRVMSTDTDSED